GVGVEGVAAAAQVGAGAERASRAGDDDRADVVVLVGRIERLDQLTAHARRERVHALGSVQRDGRYAGIDRVADLLPAVVAHPLSSEEPPPGTGGGVAPTVFQAVRTRKGAGPLAPRARVLPAYVRRDSDRRKADEPVPRNQARNAASATLAAVRPRRRPAQDGE